MSKGGPPSAFCTDGWSSPGLIAYCEFTCPYVVSAGGGGGEWEEVVVVVVAAVMDKSGPNDKGDVQSMRCSVPACSEY